MTEKQTPGEGVTRLSFIKGAAAGAAAVGLPVAALAGQDEAVVANPSAHTPKEPVVAYVRDVKRGEVTVMSGTSETTYRDPKLVKRLLSAAPGPELANGGGIDVVAP